MANPFFRPLRPAFAKPAALAYAHFAVRGNSRRAVQPQESRFARSAIVD
jgi:hypothetical protein